MNTNLLSGIGSYQNLISNLQVSVNQSSSSDFSQVLDSTVKESGANDLNAGAKQQNLDNREKELKVEDNTSTKKSEVTDNDSTTKVDDNTGASDKVQSRDADTKVSDEPDSEEMEVIATAAMQMVNSIAEVFEVPVEAVEEALNELGIEDINLLDSSVMPQVAVALTDATDTMDIMTNEDLFADVKMLMTEAEDLMDQLSQELEIPVEDLKQHISEAVEAINPKDAVIEDAKPEVLRSENAVIEGIAEDSNFAEALHIDKAIEADDDDRSNNNHNEQNTTENKSPAFFQSVTDTLKEAVLEKVDETPLSYTTSTEQIMNQVTESLKLTMKEDMTEMELQLHPASLGNVKVQVSAKDGVVTANFTTQNEQVKAALETQLVQLKDQMNEQGIKVEAVEVTVNSHAFERNLNEEGERGNNGSEETKKRSRRSINLDALDEIDLEEESEVKIVADMMARQGNSVDYLA